MKLRSAILAMFVVLSVGLFAQEAAKPINDTQLNLGLLYGSYEKSMNDFLTVKGELSYGVPANKSSIWYDNTLNLSVYGNFYWDKYIIDWFDLGEWYDDFDWYFGLGLSYAIDTYKPLQFVYESGIRWHFSDKWSLNAAYSDTNMGLGVTMKL